MTRRWLESITNAIERVTDRQETTAEKLVRLGWNDEAGRELSWDFWRNRARWPVSAGRNRVEYASPHQLNPGSF